MDINRPAQHVTLEGVLRELATTATDALIALLREGESLAAARLVCKALRDTIDSNIKVAKFDVNSQKVELWKAGCCAPLARFTRCTSVDVSASYTEGADVSFPTLLALPFIGLPLDARRRVTDLTIASLHSELETDIPQGHIVSSLAALLPSLRAVNLVGFPSLESLEESWEPRVVDDPIQQRLMYDALATLPCLEQLSVPYSSGLEHVGELAGTLKHLKVHVFTDPHVFTEGAVRGILQLRHLEHLEIDSSPHGNPDAALKEAAGGIRLLLERVGALGGSLQRLEVNLDTNMLYDALSSDAMASISKLQRLRHLTLKSCCLTKGDLELVPGDGPRGVLPRLLACLPPSLEALDLRIEFREPDEEFDDDDPNAQADINVKFCGCSCKGVTVSDMATTGLVLVTRLLLTSCRACQGGLGRLCLGDLTIIDEDWPEHLQHLQGVLRRCSRVQVTRLYMDSTLYARDALAAVEIFGKPEALVLFSSLPCTVLTMRQAEEPHTLRQRDGAAEGLAVPLRQTASLIVASDVAKAVMQRLTTKGPASRFLLLRGSLLVTLAKLQGDFLDSFIRSIQKQVPSLRAYQLLPAAVAAASKGALMLEAGREPGEADAVLLAVRDVAAKLEPGALEVVPLREPEGSSRRSISNYMNALELELQALWDDMVARRQVGEREWLRQLLEVWEQLSDLPPAVSV